MQPLTNVPAATAAGITTVLADIDDTLTSAGKLPLAAYAALDSLSRCGYRVVLVTGRPAGWCDLIARLWPVAGVVGENGAFYMAYDDVEGRLLQRFHGDAEVRAAQRARLDALARQILAAVPGAALASDHAYRVADLAIDYCEDVAPLDDAAVARIERLFAEAGATARRSAGHVNGWFGQHDKLSMTRVLFAEHFGVDLATALEHAIYVGDSPNDAPMFEFFPLSVGVANVRRFEGKMAHWPAFVTQREAGEGFAELAAWLMSAQRAATRNLTPSFEAGS